MWNLYCWTRSERTHQKKNTKNFLLNFTWVIILSNYILLALKKSLKCRTTSLYMQRTAACKVQKPCCLETEQKLKCRQPLKRPAGTHFPQSNLSYPCRHLPLACLKVSQLSLLILMFIKLKYVFSDRHGKY